MTLKKVAKICIIFILGTFLFFYIFNYFSYKIQQNKVTPINQSPNNYSLSIYYSPVAFPLFFAVHPWVIISSPEYGVERIEIHSIKNKALNNYLFINSKAPYKGVSLFVIPGFWHSSPAYKSILLYQEEGPQTKEAVLAIHESVNKYPYLNKYHATPGPNSNTFAQWVIDSFLNDKNIKLPLNAFGKNFNIKK